MTEALKIYRFKKVALFPTLNPKELFLAKETNVGYTVDIGNGEWIGLPKSLVEHSPRVFELYDHNKHRQIKKRKKFKRPRINNQKTY